MILKIFRMLLRVGRIILSNWTKVFIIIVVFSLYIRIQGSSRGDNRNKLMERNTLLNVNYINEEPVLKDYTKEDVMIYANSKDFRRFEQDDLINSNDWTQVLSSGNTVFIYSAYLDDRNPETVIRIVAIVKKRSIKPEQCLVWDSSGASEIVDGQVEIIKEGWKLPYVAAFIVCNLPHTLDTSHLVLVRPQLGNSRDMKSSIIIRSIDHPRVGKMSICVKPFHLNYNRALWLIEFIEMYRLLGADKFIFYNHGVGPDVKEVLAHYKDMGIVSLLPWNLPVLSQDEIRTEGIFAALNDCSLRSIGSYSFVANVDFDEFLIPKQKPTLIDVLEEKPRYSAYMFQNVFFYIYWENDTTVDEVLFNKKDTIGTILPSNSSVPFLQTVYKTRRLSTPHRYNIRSKYIVRPEKVVQLGNHQVWKYISGVALSSRTAKIDASVGLSHHYRVCEFGGYSCLEGESQIDRSAHQWLLPLVRRVTDTCSKLFQTPICPPVPKLGRGN